MLLAVVVASAALGAGFVEWSIRGDPGAETTGRPAGPNTSAAAGATGSTASAPTAASSAHNMLDACRALFTQELQAQLAADESMAQWQLHIDAMNQLVAGKITLAEATAYWNSTRKGAIHRVERFHRLDGRLARSAHECKDSGKADPHLVACVRATRVVGRSLDAARTATKTWRHHIREMEMLRDGNISPARALNMWLMMWRSGQDQVARYNDQALKSLSERCA